MKSLRIPFRSIEAACFRKVRQNIFQLNFSDKFNIYWSNITDPVEIVCRGHFE
jgi:hypothetical protein